MTENSAAWQARSQLAGRPIMLDAALFGLDEDHDRAIGLAAHLKHM